MGDAVEVDGRKGTLKWDLVPYHAFAKVLWLDDLTESDYIPVQKILKAGGLCTPYSPIGRAWVGRSVGRARRSRANRRSACVGHAWVDNPRATDARTNDGPARAQPTCATDPGVWVYMPPAIIHMAVSQVEAFLETAFFPTPGLCLHRPLLFPK